MLQRLWWVLLSMRLLIFKVLRLGQDTNSRQKKCQAQRKERQQSKKMSPFQDKNREKLLSPGFLTQT